MSPENKVNKHIITCLNFLKVKNKKTTKKIKEIVNALKKEFITTSPPFAEPQAYPLL